MYVNKDELYACIRANSMLNASQSIEQNENNWKFAKKCGQ